jgi:hypothetical protein
VALFRLARIRVGEKSINADVELSLKIVAPPEFAKILSGASLERTARWRIRGYLEALKRQSVVEKEAGVSLVEDEAGNESCGGEIEALLADGTGKSGKRRFRRTASSHSNASSRKRSGTLIVV